MVDARAHRSRLPVISAQRYDSHATVSRCQVAQAVQAVIGGAVVNIDYFVGPARSFEGLD